MTQPAYEVAFEGFAGWPVFEYAVWLRNHAEFADAGIDDYYFRLNGTWHADFATEQLLRMRDIPDWRPFDPQAEVQRYNPEPRHAQGTEAEYDLAHYTSAFIDRLAQKAKLLRDVQQGRPSPALDVAEELDAPDRGERIREHAAVLPAADVQAVADELDDLARALSHKTGVRLPRALSENDRGREQETQDRAHGENDRPAPVTPGADLERRLDAALDAVSGRAAETRPNGTLRWTRQPLAEHARAALRGDALGNDRVRKALLRSLPSDRADAQDAAAPDAAGPAQATQEPAKPARVARPGTAASRHTGPAHPPSTGRAR
ncbi:hypothetical protein CU254_41720 (plasmid) [Amycolatopsis sp. AA4]|uniref:hypothetical protein n=1 Tax=Actinomycetes TaxID=1760 RepID=UPI0001B5516B|nr:MULTISPECIES: hypothetical protein [Actinomycetes]ATY17098.1 hypothetical protein CU254_41720 [Amycolatopsis sp. AA4]EFL12395.1 predicted protein [Streptomyces sp. AA4]